MPHISGLVYIICGDREWKSPGPIIRLVDALPENSVVVTGGARGADTQAWDAARRRGLRNVRVDAPWESAYGKRAGPVRNGWMLDIALALTGYNAGRVRVVAFHDHIASSKGTADMLKKARSASVAYEIKTSNSDLPEG